MVKGECAECAGKMEDTFSLKDLVVEARKRTRKYEADTWNPGSSFTGGHGHHAAHHSAPHAKCPPGTVRHRGSGSCVALRGGHRA
jgi:hypothetical protein